MKQVRYAQLAAFVLLIAAFVAIRLWDLTASCLWFDEIFSVHAAEHPWNEILSFVALDLIHPPLFYVLLKLWIGVGGESLAWLRLLPFLFAVVSIIPFILFLRELKQTIGMQLICLLLLIVNGTFLKYSLEVRMYCQLQFLSSVSFWLFARYFYKGKSFVVLVLVNVALVYTHYFGWLMVVSEVAAVLIFQRIKWRRIVTMFGITLACFVPWAVAIFKAASDGSALGQNIGWMSRPGILAMFQLIFGFIEPFYYQSSSNEPISMFAVSLPLLAIGLTVLGLFFVNWRRHSVGDHQIVKLLALLVFLPLTTVFVLSWILPYSLWGTRHLIIVFGPCIVLAGIAINSLPARGLKAAVITLIVLFSGYAAVTQVARRSPQYAWCALETLTAPAADQNAPIYAFEDLIAYHVWVVRRNDPIKIDFAKVVDVEGVREDKAYFLPRGFEEIKTIDFASINDRRFWLVHRATKLSDSEPPLRNFLVSGYRITESSIVAVDGEDLGIYLLEK